MMKRLKTLSKAMTRLITLFFVVMSFSGCGTLHTERYPETSPKSGAKGVIYSLPMRMAKLVVSRTPVPVPAALNKEITDKTDEVKKAKETLEKAEDTLARNDKTAKILPDNVDVQAALKASREAVEKAQTELKAPTEKLAALLELKKAAEAATEGKTVAYEVKLELLPAEADPRHVFVANLNHNALRDDNILLNTTAAGLLTTTDLTAADRTSDIIISIAGAVGAFGDVSSGLTEFSLLDQDDTSQRDDEVTRPQTPECADQSKKIVQQHVFDPSDDTEVTQVNQHLQDCFVPYQLRVRRFPTIEDTDYVSESATLDANKLNEADGLIYRRSLPYLVEVARYHGDLAVFAKTPQGDRSRYDAVIDKLPENIDRWFKVEQAAIVQIPNAGPLGIIPFNAGPFVTTQQKVEFTDGQPITWSTSKPSELAAFFRIPVEVAKALVSVPAELLKIRVDYSSDAEKIAGSNLQLLCTNLRIQALRNATDDNAENDNEVTIPDVCAVDSAAAGGEGDDAG